MNKQERNFFLFLLGARSFSSKDRASLSVLLAIVSIGIVSSSAPFALEVEGLQEAVELDSEVELLESEHAAIYNCSLRHVSRGKCGQRPLNYFEFVIMLRSCAFCAIMRLCS